MFLEGSLANKTQKRQDEFIQEIKSGCNTSFASLTLYSKTGSRLSSCELQGYLQIELKEDYLPNYPIWIRKESGMAYFRANTNVSPGLDSL